jgi:hypothetical protein
MANIKLVLPSLHKGQLLVKNDPARFKVLVAGRRFGKSFLIQDDIVHSLLRGEYYGYFAPDYKKMAEVYRYVEQTFKPLVSDATLIESSNKTEGRIQLKTGGVIEFWSMIDPDCGRSRRYHRVAIDEAGLEITLLDRWREAIRATLIDFKGKALIVGTPKPPKSIQLKDYGFYQMYLRGLDPMIEDRANPGKMIPNPWKSFHAPSKANPLLSEEEIEDMRHEPGMTKRIAKQEIDAEFLSQSTDALWNMDLIDQYRRQVPVGVTLVSTVLFLDPGNITSESSADMTGIVIAGKGSDGHYYVLNDLSGHYSPNKMATIVVNACSHYGARLYFESNQGGQYISNAIKNVSPISCTPVPSTKGKEQRALAPLGLYELGFVHHVVEFVDMENEQCVSGDTLILTERGNIPICDVTSDDRVMTRNGWAELDWVGVTGVSKLVRVKFDGGHLDCTKNHPIFNGKKFVGANELESGKINVWRVKLNENTLNSTALNILSARKMGITKSAHENKKESNQASTIGTCGSFSSDRSRREIIYTTLTKTQTIMQFPTLNVSHQKNTRLSTQEEDGVAQHLSGEARTSKRCGLINRTKITSAYNAVANLNQMQPKPSCVPVCVKAVTTTESIEIVYNLQTAKGYLPEFVANGILVHNCNWNSFDTKMKSPNRMDALCGALNVLASKGVNGVKRTNRLRRVA